MRIYQIASIRHHNLCLLLEYPTVPLLSYLPKVNHVKLATAPNDSLSVIIVDATCPYFPKEYFT